MTYDRSCQGGVRLSHKKSCEHVRQLLHGDEIDTWTSTPGTLGSSTNSSFLSLPLCSPFYWTQQGTLCKCGINGVSCVITDEYSNCASRSWRYKVVDVKLFVRGAVKHLQPVRHALSGHCVRDLALRPTTLVQPPTTGPSLSPAAQSPPSLPLPLFTSFQTNTHYIDKGYNIYD